MVVLASRIVQIGRLVLTWHYHILLRYLYTLDSLRSHESSTIHKSDRPVSYEGYGLIVCFPQFSCLPVCCEAVTACRPFVVYHYSWDVEYNHQSAQLLQWSDCCFCEFYRTPESPRYSKLCRNESTF